MAHATATVVAALLVGALSSSASAQAGAPTRVKTEKGVFVVPGAAYVDGRDLEASPPLTVMKVNAWESPQRLKRACTIGHGQTVKLLAAERVASDDRHYFKVAAKGCEGWLPETFLSLKRERAVGTRH
jgi:hypothetical protein